MPISPADFDSIRTLVRRRSAIVIDENKAYLAESRLAALARTEGLGSLDALLKQLRAGDRGLEQKVVEAMTTNETYFFRDAHPFEMLRQTLLPQLIAARRGEQRLAVWRAACSTGQEAYSLAILIREHFPDLLSWRLTIFGTDLATAVVARARAGRYTGMEVSRGLSDGLRTRYFTASGDHWQLSPTIRGMVEFRAMNLAEPWAALPTFDLILLRNVLIYFESPTRRDILRRVRQHLRPDGALILGGSETTIGLDPSWARVDAPPSNFYRPSPP